MLIGNISLETELYILAEQMQYLREIRKRVLPPEPACLSVNA